MNSQRRTPRAHVLRLVVTAVCVVAVIAGGSVVASAGDSGPPAATVGGNGSFTHANTTYLWLSESVTVEVTPASPYPGSRVCLHARQYRQTVTLTCIERPDPRNSSVVRFVVESWSSPGRYELVVHSGGQNVTINRKVATVVVVRKGGDVDHDRLSNIREREGPTNFTSADTDTDGLSDGAEVNDYGTSPTTDDTDDDGLRDGFEILLGTDPQTSTHNVTSLPPGVLLPGDAEREENATESPTSANGASQLVTFVRDHWLLTGVALMLVVVTSVVLDRQFTGAVETSSQPLSDSDATQPQTSEARLLQELHDQGGREKQSDIARRMGWSKAKASRVLSKLEARGLIEKEREGRQNVIVLLEDRTSRSGKWRK